MLHLYPDRPYNGWRRVPAEHVTVATADVHAVRLVTLNVKHFPMLDNIIAPY